MNLLYHHRTQGKAVEAIHITSITNALRAFGHQVEIVSPPGVDPERQEVQSKDGAKGTFWQVISRKCPEFVFELLELGYNFFAFRTLKKKILTKKIDGIYERYFLFSLASVFLCNKFGIKIIFEVNDSAFFPRVRPLFFKSIAKAIEKYTLSKATAIIVVSQVFKNRLISVGIPEEKIVVIHNGVDRKKFSSSLFRNEKKNGNSKVVTIGFTGIFVFWHGFDMLLKVFKKLNTEYSNLQLLLIGDGPMQDELKTWVRTMELEDKVAMPGRVSHHEIAPYVSKMDICVIAKHAGYTSPVKLFEYMALGKPVVAPNMDNIREIVSDSVDAILFEADNVMDFEEKLKYLIENKDIRKKIGKKAENKIENNFTWEKNAKAVEELFSNA